MIMYAHAVGIRRDSTGACGENFVLQATGQRGYLFTFGILGKVGLTSRDGIGVLTFKFFFLTCHLRFLCFLDLGLNKSIGFHSVDRELIVFQHGNESGKQLVGVHLLGTILIVKHRVHLG